MFVKLYTSPSIYTALDGLPIFNTFIKFMHQTRAKYKSETITKVENKFTDIKFNLFPSNYLGIGSDQHGLVYVKELNGYIRIYINFKSILPIINSTNYKDGCYSGEISLIQSPLDCNYVVSEHISSEYSDFKQLYFSTYDINGKKVSINGSKLVSAVTKNKVYKDRYNYEYEYVGKFTSHELSKVSRISNFMSRSTQPTYRTTSELSDKEVFHLYAVRSRHSFEYVFTKTPKRLIETNNECFLIETILMQYLRQKDSYQRKDNVFLPTISFPGYHYSQSYAPCYYIDFDSGIVRMKKDTDEYPFS